MPLNDRCLVKAKKDVYLKGDGDRTRMNSRSELNSRSNLIGESIPIFPGFSVSKERQTGRSVADILKYPRS